MITLNGKSVYGGIAIGKILFYKKKGKSVKRRHIENAEAEKKRFQSARTDAKEELKQLYIRALEDMGEANAMIFETHEIMLDDMDYIESVENMIETQKINAEYAVASTSDNFAKMFEAMDDPYMQGRAADVRDISERVINHLCGAGEHRLKLSEPVIIAAEDLTPSETVQLDKDKVLGFITMLGSSTSHTAILARTMNIPAVIGVGEGLSEKYDGRYAVADGTAGVIYIDPDEKTMASMQKKRSEEIQERQLLEEFKGKENVTRTGKKINIFANIGNISDVGLAVKNDAGGIGLFRSEFLYLENDTYPTEEQQFRAYRQVAENMAGKKVIIRTLDIGADKKIGYFNLAKEENPALGYRAIRICLTRPEIFKTQLRALYRAALFGNISIMFPMITSVWEVRQIKKIIEEVKTDLKQQGIPFKEVVELGIMIETPAAAIISRELAKEVDFFSIGTNDLTQYTLAVDRQNTALDAFYDPHHPALLELIRMTAENAHAQGKWVGICGELGADMEMTETLLDMGIDELSVSPAMILPLRKKVRECE